MRPVYDIKRLGEPPKFEIEELHEIFRRYGCKHILDAGCGLNWFKKHAPKDVRVLGIDKYSDKADVLHDLEQKLPFRSNEFDGILCHHVIEHVENPPAVLNEFHRVLRKGGIVYLETPAWFSRYNREDPSHIHSFSRKSLEDLLSKAGFKIIKTWYQNVGMPGYRILRKIKVMEKIPTVWSSVCVLGVKP